MKTGLEAVAGAQREELRERLRGAGFDEVRFAAVSGPAGASLHDWIGAGRQADMNWIGRNAEKRVDAGLVVSGAQTVIALGVNYWPGKVADRHLRQEGTPVWARYALHEDYHDTIKRGLVDAGRILEETLGIGATDYRYYVDTGPVLERGWAARAGMGFLGKNGMLISRVHGNWLFLAAIITRARVEPDAPLLHRKPSERDEEPAGLLCGKCTRCVDACPTDAIPEPGVVDARLCVSYQTIENRGVIPRELRPGIGDRVYGCDVCLEVCPWNRFARVGHSVLLAARHEIAETSLLELLELTPATFAEKFRRTAIKRVKFSGIVRNACVVAGNLKWEDALPRLRELACHELPVIRAHAVWAVHRIAGRDRARELLADARAAERDETVLAEYRAEEKRD